MSALISVVIPCYNHGIYLEETIESIFQARDKYPLEIIVVNDGSTDLKTLEVFKKIEDIGIFVLHQDNQGLGKARNNGIALAKGKYILPLDSDNNVLYPYLNDAIDILEANKADIVYGDARYIGESSGVWKNRSFDGFNLLYNNYIDACAVFRKSVWSIVGGYAIDMPYMGCEDWNFWLKSFNAQQVFYYMEKQGFEYRVLSTSMIRTVSQDFDSSILGYNVKSLSDLYQKEMKKKKDLLDNVFYGSAVRKSIKLFLNHFGLYKY